MMEAVAVLDFVHEQDYEIEDVALAARCAGPSILITADCAASVERIARRIHAASDRAAFPFVRVAAATLPIDAEYSRRGVPTCSTPPAGEACC